VRFPCVTDAAPRALAGRRRLTAGVGLGLLRAVGRAGGPPVEVMFPAVPHDRCVRRGKPEWRGGRGGALPGWRAWMPRRAGPWCSPSCPVVAKYRHGRRRQAVRGTACCAQDPVRYMSVISGSVELTFACCGGLRRRFERVADSDPVRPSCRSARYKRTHHRPVGRAGWRLRTRHAYSLPC
jgi:hypothetical protein